MIFSNSRYAEGTIFKSYDSRSKKYGVSVLRVFPENSSEFFYYTWAERDRIDSVAEKFFGDPDAWWQIMDFNPEIMNPLDISLGTVLRIPRG
jgi:hypothetical protein